MAEPTRKDLRVPNAEMREAAADPGPYFSMDWAPDFEQLADLTEGVSDAQFDAICHAEGYVRLFESDRLYDRRVCEALEAMLKRRGIYPSLGRHTSTDPTVDAEEILDVICGLLVEGGDRG